VTHQIPTALDHLILVDPDIASTRQHVHMRARFPIGVRLIPVRIAKSDMYAGEFLVL
jgi:hypothetical protein